MNYNEMYIREELRRLEVERPNKAARHYQRWLADRDAERKARRRALIGWLGDRMVATGERLRSWSMAGIASQVSPPHNDPA
jgi:hypothetical protein